jgi:branched-chain amino acid transport system permease protein
VNPELLSWHESGRRAADDHPRRPGHLRGAVLGAAAFTLLKEALSNHGIVGAAATIGSSRWA